MIEHGSIKLILQASDLSSMEQKMVKEIKKEDKFMWAQVDSIITITITTAIITTKIISTMVEISLKTTRQLYYVIWRNAYISS